MKELLKVKFTAFFIHALVSSVVIGVAAYLVFFVFYPGLLSEISAGARIFALLVIVELVLGPTLSLVVFNPIKSRRELFQDYSLIGLVQFSALMFGLYSAFLARPVYMVFVKDRFEVVTPADLGVGVLRQHGMLWQVITAEGSLFRGVEFPSDVEKLNDILFSAVDGKDIQYMPEYYKIYDAEHAYRSGVPIKTLIEDAKAEKSPSYKIFESLLDTCSQCRGVPLMGYDRVWTAVLNKGVEIPIAYVDFDPF